jgi:hypothetical protein
VIADVVSYESPESASSTQWVARSSARASMNTAMTLACDKVPRLCASFRTFHRLPPTSHEIHSARARVEGVMRFRLLPRPDCQGVEAPPATPHIRGLEVNDSGHLASW